MSNNDLESLINEALGNIRDDRKSAREFLNEIANCISKIINNKILVIPEGIYSECEKLFNLCLKIALKNKNLLFIWRVHPVINIKKVLQNLKLNAHKLEFKIDNNEFSFRSVLPKDFTNFMKRNKIIFKK